MIRTWINSVLYIPAALLLTNCGPNPNEEQIRTTVKDVCEGPAELSHSRSGGFTIRVSPCQGRTGAWGPILYGENERAVKQEIDVVLKKLKFRCRFVIHTGIKTGATRNDYECQRISRF